VWIAARSSASTLRENGLKGVVRVPRVGRRIVRAARIHPSGQEAAIAGCSVRGVTFGAFGAETMVEGGVLPETLLSHKTLSRLAFVLFVTASS